MTPLKTNILVLEDEKDTRAEINEFLTSNGIQVQEAGTPSEAFRVLSWHPIDIAILDIDLPEMSGMDVLKEIQRGFPKIQVILMSGSSNKESVANALRQGACDYLRKPFRLHEMQAAIEKALKYASRAMLLNEDHFDHLEINMQQSAIGSRKTTT